MKNTGKNTKKRGGTSGKGFDVLGQPSPELKKKGWQEKQYRQLLLDIMANFGKLNYKKVLATVADMKIHPENYSFNEVMLLKYMSDPKFIKDYLDRMGAKAKDRIDLTSNDETISENNKITEILESIASKNV